MTAWYDGTLGAWAIRIPGGHDMLIYGPEADGRSLVQQMEAKMRAEAVVREARLVADRRALDRRFGRRRVAG